MPWYDSRTEMLVGLEIMLADSATFQEWTNSTTPEEAKQHVYFGEVSVPEVNSNGDPTGDEIPIRNLRPFAAIDIMGQESDSVGVSEPNCLFVFDSQLVLLLEANTTTPGNHKQSKLEFESRVGKIMDELKEMVGNDRPGGREGDNYGYLSIHVLSQLGAAERTDYRNRCDDDYWTLAFALNLAMT